MSRYSRAFLTIIAIAVIGVAVIVAQKRKPSKTIVRGIVATVSGTTSAPALLPDVQRRYDTFLMVWSTLRDSYFDKTFGNLDWNSIKTEFEPKAKAAKSDAELHNLLNSMLGRLNRSHLGVIPPEVYTTLNDVKRRVKAKERAGDAGQSNIVAGPETGDIGNLETIDENANYGIGVELSLVAERFMITRMDPNSAAEYAGLKRGYIVDKVNGISLQDMLNRILIYNATVHSTSVKQFVPAYVVSAMLNGERDSYVTIGYLDENDQAKEAKIRREVLKEKSIAIAPNFPPQQLSFESRSLNESVGYIRFNMFAIPVIEKFCRSISEFKTKSGLVIDLRGNTGGILASVPTLAGMLTAESLDLGTSIYRTRSEPLKAPSKVKNFTGRVVVLVDDRTASAAEMFALSLREDGRAFIVGQHTSGEALPSVIVNLPTGARLMYPFANYRSPAGTYIEGNGIEPDRVVQVDRKSLLSGKDVQLDAAVSMLEDSVAFAQLKSKTPAIYSISGPVASSDPPPAAKAVSQKGQASPVTKAPPQLMAPSLPLARRFAPGQDEMSKKYVDGFLSLIGGADALRAVNNLTAVGAAKLSSFGTVNSFRFRSFRDAGPKYSVILESVATGEIREVMNGTAHWVQSDFGLYQDLSKIPGIESPDVFTAITDLADYTTSYPSLSYTGTYDRDGRKTAVIEGRTKSGREIALAFDAETGLLVNATKGYSSISFSDYRKVGSLLLPFNIDQTGIINIDLDAIEINVKTDASLFEKKENCYDKVD